MAAWIFHAPVETAASEKGLLLRQERDASVQRAIARSQRCCTDCCCCTEEPMSPLSAHAQNTQRAASLKSPTILSIDDDDDVDN